ncbi:MAG: exonuclease subunit SbcD [Bacteroidales bacterium]|jgi:exonuclease SbcD|nr:exonuclease subunit SbcD [Bacteroidales bacterium]
MKIIHTSDWHIGHFFQNWDRKEEFSFFFEQLHHIITEEKPDVLIVAGDIFHNSNPAAESVTFYYQELMSLKQLAPNLQIIIVAGNHDSPSRLQAPAVILHNFNIHIVGMVPKQKGEVEWEKMLFPLYHNGTMAGVCMAVPFLRRGDYERHSDEESEWASLRRFYSALFEKAQVIAGELPIIATAHLAIAADDTVEQTIGAVDSLACTVFPEGINYVALGHIHKAYPVGGNPAIRYSGSPLPISLNARNRQHQVILVEFKGDRKPHIKFLPIAVPVPVKLVPDSPVPLSELVGALHTLSDEEEIYLEANWLQTEPVADVRDRIFAALEGKKARFCGIKTTIPTVENAHDCISVTTVEELQNLNPEMLAMQYFLQKNGVEMNSTVRKLLQEAIAEVQLEKGEAQ